MRKFLPIFILCLFLVGCAQSNTQSESYSTSLYQPSETTALALSEKVSYPMQFCTYRGIYVMNSSILLISDEGAGTKFTQISKEDGSVTNSCLIEDSLYRDSGIFFVSAERIVYFSRSRDCLVVLDDELKETRRIYVPDQPVGVIVPSSTANLAYYCNSGNLYALNLSTGLPSFLADTKQMSLQGSLYQGKILILSDDNGCFSFIDSSNGATVKLDGSFKKFHIDEDCCVQVEGDTPQTTLISGVNFSTWVLNYMSIDAFPLSEISAVISVSESNEGQMLSLWDQYNGNSKGQFSLAETLSIIDVRYDVSLDCIWVLSYGYDGSYHLNGIPLDDIESTTSISVYIPYFSEASPDSFGLSSLQSSINDSFEFPVQVSFDSVYSSAAFPNTTFEKFYMAGPAKDSCNELTELLTEIPKEFWLSICSSYNSDSVHVYLFSSFQNTSTVQCAGYYDLIDGIPCLIINSTNLEDSFYHALGHLIEEKILLHCMEEWICNNPYEFQYTNIFSESGTDDGYLLDDYRFFASVLAMTFVTEDVAETFSAAMSEDHYIIFRGSVMQEKLVLLCKSIREVFSFSDFNHELPWEQYAPYQFY